MGFGNKDEHSHHVDYEADLYTGITTFHGLVRIYNAKFACLSVCLYVCLSVPRTWGSRVFWVCLAFTAMVLFFCQVPLEWCHGVIGALVGAILYLIDV